MVGLKAHTARSLWRSRSQGKRDQGAIALVRDFRNCAGFGRRHDENMRALMRPGGACGGRCREHYADLVAMGVGCVKTCTREKDAELFPLSSSPDCGRQRFCFSN